MYDVDKLYDDSLEFCQKQLKAPEVGLMEARQSQLAQWVAQATKECYAANPFEGKLERNQRLVLHCEIRDRVLQMNQDVGFAFIVIILGAILSWLIQRLLDRLFPK